MSLKNRLEGIKKDVEAKKAIEEITEGKESLREVASHKQALSDRISDLNSLVDQVKDAYSSSRRSLDNFKESSANIKALYSEYEDYLKEKGINSVEDIIHSDDFQEETEVKEYHEAGAAKLNKAGERGKLGKSVEKVASAKTAVKEALPDMKLDFRGKKQAGEDMSPRHASILKIESYISELETELSEIIKQESEKKNEMMPKIKEMLSLEIDKVFSEGDLYLERYGANKNFISDKALELGGDELWPQIKEEAKQLITDKMREPRNGEFEIREISYSLDAEKFIYDINKIKNEHSDLMELNNDSISFQYLSNEIKNKGYFRGTDNLTIKGENAYQTELLEKVEYFKEKNVEAKKVCEEVMAEYLSAFKTAKEHIPSGFLAGKKTKEDIDEFSSKLDKAIEEMTNLEAPENYFCQNRYEFSNKLGAIAPRLVANSHKEWTSQIKKELETVRENLRERMRKLDNSEHQEMNTLLNQTYDLRNYETTEMNGFDIPYQSLTELDNYKRFKNKDTIDTFYKQLDGLNVPFNELLKLINEAKEEITNQIANYPDSKDILEKFKELEEKYDENYKRDFIIIQKKMAAKKGKQMSGYDRKDAYDVKQELFNI